MRKLETFEEVMTGRMPRRFKNQIEQSEQERWHYQRANWSRLVPEITFVMLRCDAKRKRVFTNDIVEEAMTTYPGDFDGPLVLLTLQEAKKHDWGYAAGNWFRGWKLTKKGLTFAKDIERRRMQRKALAN